jgi:hypothetical protein
MRKQIHLILKKLQSSKWINGKQLIFSVLIIFIVSCEKQETMNINGIGEPSDTQLYFPLTIGSYWVYQTFTQNDTGFTTNGNLDSMFIEKDTVINGNTYFKFNRIPPQITPAFRRDSLGYILDETGRIYFSINNFTDTLYSILDSMSNTPLVSYKMESKNALINAPAGTFNCYDYTGFYYSNPPYSDLFGSPRLTHDFYAPSIGLLEKVFFFSASPYITEKRLVRFHIAQ